MASIINKPSYTNHGIICWNVEDHESIMTYRTIHVISGNDAGVTRLIISGNQSDAENLIKLWNSHSPELWRYELISVT